jgi:beta-lactam-binding protein with PASTA domain
MDLTPKKWLARIGYVILFTVVAGLSATATVTFLIHSGNDVEVPALLGKTVPEAEIELSKRNLRLDIQGSQYNDQFPEGVVVYQFVGSGERVRDGRSVGVYLSKGGRESLAPRLTGLTLEAARTVLQSSELSGASAATTCSDEAAEGTVVAQDPPPGGVVEKGLVTLLGSGGPCRNRFVMPDLYGRSLRDVIWDFDRKGFLIRFFQYVERDGVEPRTILDVSPRPGSVVRPYDSIVFTLAGASRSSGREIAGTLVYVPVPIPPSLFRREAKLWLDRGEGEGTYSIDFLPTPGENAPFVLWLTPGSQLALTMNGKELWRKVF